MMLDIYPSSRWIWNCESNNFSGNGLIRILNQFSTMHKNQRLIRELANQGPDGSHLASAPTSAVEAESTGPPPELPRLLAIEERIRRLRHIRRILVAKKAAAESRQELASLRRSPIKKAMLTICGGSLGMCVVAKTYPRISELVRGAKWTSNDKNIWLKDVGKTHWQKLWGLAGGDTTLAWVIPALHWLFLAGKIFDNLSYANMICLDMHVGVLRVFLERMRFNLLGLDLAWLSTSANGVESQRNEGS